jgi:ribosomal protein S18 acetylase RimI-like enzyme
MKVLGWNRPGRRAYMVSENGSDRPVGYGEINLLDQRRREFWLGHLIVDPRRRGRGVGAAMVRLLIEEAIASLGAERISLVVFPANEAAVRCYRTAGMREICHEHHYFVSSRRQALLLRMAVDA